MFYGLVRKALFAVDPETAHELTLEALKLGQSLQRDPRFQALLERMADRDMVLLCHGGEEKAVDAEEAQRLGNPLRLRQALDLGLKVVVAHCASLGHGDDLDLGVL